MKTILSALLVIATLVATDSAFAACPKGQVETCTTIKQKKVCVCNGVAEVQGAAPATAAPKK